MENPAQEIRDTFTIFHDGYIECWEMQGSTLKLTIACTYLAEMIKPEFNLFHVEISNVSILEFEPWYDYTEEKIILADPALIFKNELGIMSAELKDECVHIFCDQSNRDVNYSGGMLRLSGDAVLLADEQKNTVTIDHLKTISTNYWSRFR